MYVHTWYNTFLSVLCVLCVVLFNSNESLAEAAVPFQLRLVFDLSKIQIADPLFARVELVNSRDDRVVVVGTLPSFRSGNLWIEYRLKPEMNWTTFVPAHVDIEPGLETSDDRLLLEANQNVVYYECILFRRIARKVGTGYVHESIIGMPQIGDVEFRARAKIGSYDPVTSSIVVVSVTERSDIETVALDLGEAVIRKASPLDSPGVARADIEQLQKLIKYFPDSSVGWLLEWKLNLATWMEYDDLVKPRAALERIVTLRDKETGVRHEILTASLAHGYIQLKNTRRARDELEKLPEGAVVRKLLMGRVEELERRIKRMNPD